VVNREIFDPAAGTPGTVTLPETWESGTKDTVIAYPGQITRVKAKFDIPGRYVWHCHILEHEDNEMMRPYTVGAFGTRDVVSNDPTDHVVKLESEYGGIRIDLPAGTFDEEVEVVLTTAAVPSSDRATVKVSNVGIEITNNKAKQPRKYFVLTMHYRESDVAGLDKTKLVLAYYDDTHSRWVPVASKVDQAARTVTGSFRHLSKFAVVQLTSAANLNTIKAFPNPFNPRTDAAMIIDNLTDKADIRIYTVAGELVRKLDYTSANGRAAWDGKNDSGRTVASGVYLLFIDSPSGKKTLKIAVEK
jgi:hypothetical protein